MLWGEPNLLWLLVVVAGLGVVLMVLLRRREARLTLFAEEALARRLTPGLDRRRRVARILLRVAALLSIVVALAGPKWGFHWEEVKREGIDLIVAIDTSRSMLATDVKPNRLERAKLAVLDLVEYLQGDRIGLVAFAGTAFLECPLTLDYAAFERSLRATTVGIIPRGGTALARAIETSLAGFEARQGKHEALILITDGEDHEGDLDSAVQLAADKGVRIYTVGIGTSEGELVPQTGGSGGYVKDRRGQVVKSRLNEEVLQEIALKTNGAYVRGLGAALGLDEVFRDHIAKMERREVASSLERRYEERFQIPLFVALLLLLLESFIGDRKSARAGVLEWLWPKTRSKVTGSTATLSSDWRLSVLILLSVPFLVGWFDPPGDRAAEGNRLYDEGKYEEAVGKYGDGLVDSPESPLLQFNMGTALYKQEKYDEAIASLSKVATTGDDEWVGRAAYNLGNSYYRLGAGSEESDPQAAIQNYEQALVAYKRAMAVAPQELDAKFNHELVAKKLAELKKRLEEQQQEEEQQEQEQQEQQQEEEQQDQEQQDQEQQQQEQQQQEEEQQQEQQQQGEQQENQEEPRQQQEERQEEQQAGEQEEPSQEQEQQAGSPEQERDDRRQEQQPAGAPQAGEPTEPTEDQQAAQAVLDTAREEELGPEEVRRPVGVLGVGEAAQDW